MRVKMVNASPDVIEHIYFKKDWQKILKQRNNIRIPTTNPLSLDSYIHDQPDSIWEIIDRDGIIVHDNDSYLSGIHENPISVLDKPSDIYFVDRETKRKYLNNNPGVLISSQKSASAIPLKASWEKVLRRGENFSWDSFFRPDVLNKVIPSNALILVDRYMFSDSFKNGVQNLMNILDSVLPADMNGTYQVLLITDNDAALKDGSINDIDTAVSEIQCVIPSLERSYAIDLEILMVKTLGPSTGYKRTPREKALRDFYGETHDRHIFSNYFIVSADHALSAVKESNKGNLIATYKQTIKFETLYAGIDNKYQDLKSLPLKSAEDFYEAVIKFRDSTEPDCLYYINSKRGNVKNIRNRLLL